MRTQETLIVRGSRLVLSMQADGTGIVVDDLVNGARWRLDESTRLAAGDVARFDHSAYASAALSAKESKVVLLGSGKAMKVGENEIRVVHGSTRGTLILRWVMEEDRLRVLADVEGTDGITALSLPGTFRPENGEPFVSAIPNGQGIFHTGKGPPFYRPLFSKGPPAGFTMAMLGQISSRGGLVTIAETDSDAVLHWEKTGQGSVRLMWLQHPSMGTLGSTREVILMATAPDLTSICKCYRGYVIEKGRFKNWEAKLAERPNLEKLFGAAIVFIGYCHDPDLDYVASLRRLKAMGIDKALVYPLYMATTMDVEKALGFRWADQRQLLPLLDELGYAAGSFIYTMDGPAEPEGDPHRNLLLNSSEKPLEKWRMKESVWYALSTEKRFEWSRRLLDNEHQGFHGVHYDVLATTPLKEDYHPDHRTDARGDRENRKQLLAYAASKGLIVSSEGFWDYMTPYYDLGNGKYPHALGGDEYCVVPMTMLVYHDCAYHTWWEVDNYNNPQHLSQGNRGHRRRLGMGGGFAQSQSAMDALLGTPPDIFPFGKQYNFVPQNHPDLYFYKYRLDDAEVQGSIECAKPVMALNRKIGKLEMTEHRLHRPDGAIQETVFADGTRVIANFSNVALEAPEVGLMQAESWKSL